ncbi:MAG: hypothetical protein LIP04_04350 [Tannerellaceae bacterium]|nr:hypothetical protein [Tannerellaceae bacterium]
MMVYYGLCSYMAVCGLKWGDGKGDGNFSVTSSVTSFIKINLFVIS